MPLHYGCLCCKVRQKNKNKIIMRELSSRERTCSMVPCFLLSNPKAVWIFCLLLLLASHPCRALRSTLAFPVTHTCTQTYTDEHMIGYKYSGQDRKCTMFARDRTHVVLISTLPPSSLSAVFCVGGGEKTCTSAYLMPFIYADLSMNVLNGAQTPHHCCPIVLHSPH